MRNRLGPAATFERVREQLPMLLDTLPELAQRALHRLSQPENATDQAQWRAIAELRTELKDGARRTRLLVIGAALIVSAALIYGLDGYRPAMILNAPTLTWLLGGLGALAWWRGSRPG